MKKLYKKLISCIVLVAFVLTIPVTSFADTNVSLKNEITVTAFENSNGLYYIETENAMGYNLRNAEKLTAILDNKLGLYKVQNMNNLYLDKVQNDLYIPIEKSSIKNVRELELVTNQYALTEAQYEDLADILNEYPAVELNVYAPRDSSDVYGTTSDGKQYRFVTVTAHDDDYEKTIAEGPDILGLMNNVVVYAISSTGLAASLGVFFTTAALGFLNINPEFLDDTTCNVRKDEYVTFNYIDFYEMGLVYITRGVNSEGSISFHTETTYFENTSGNHYESGTEYGETIERDFGNLIGKEALLQASLPYYQYYGEVGGNVRYENYTKSFRINGFDSFSAIAPK